MRGQLWFVLRNVALISSTLLRAYHARHVAGLKYMVQIYKANIIRQHANWNWLTSWPGSETTNVSIKTQTQRAKVDAEKKLRRVAQKAVKWKCNAERKKQKKNQVNPKKVFGNRTNGKETKGGRNSGRGREWNLKLAKTTLRCSHTPTNCWRRGARCRQRQSERKRQIWRPCGNSYAETLPSLGLQ